MWLGSKNVIRVKVKLNISNRSGHQVSSLLEVLGTKEDDVAAVGIREGAVAELVGTGEEKLKWINGRIKI